MAAQNEWRRKKAFNRAGILINRILGFAFRKSRSWNGKLAFNVHQPKNLLSKVHWKVGSGWRMIERNLGFGKSDEDEGSVRTTGNFSSEGKPQGLQKMAT